MEFDFPGVFCSTVHKNTEEKQNIPDCPISLMEPVTLISAPCRLYEETLNRIHGSSFDQKFD